MRFRILSILAAAAAFALASPTTDAGEVGIGIGAGVGAGIHHGGVYVGGGVGAKAYHRKGHRYGHKHYHRHPGHGHAHKKRYGKKRYGYGGHKTRVRGFGYYKGHHFIYGGYAWRHISAHHAAHNNYCHIVEIRYKGRYGPAVSCHKPKYGHVQYVAAVGY